MKALNDKIFVKIGVMPNKQGKIFIPVSAIDAGQAKINVGKVISCGPGLMIRTGEYLPMCCKEGDIITWEQYGAQSYEIFDLTETKKHIASVRSEDVTGIIEPSDGLEISFDEDALQKMEDEQLAAYKKARDDWKVPEVSENKKIYNIHCDLCHADYTKDLESPYNGYSKCEKCGEIGAKMLGIVSNLTLNTNLTPKFHQ